MPEDWNALAAEVAADLAEDGIPATLYRQGAASGSEHSPVFANPTPHPVTVLIDKFTLMEQAQNHVEVGDKKVFMSASGLAITPSTEDWLEVGGTEYTIKNVDSLEPGGVPVLYTIQARRRIDEG